jgi:CheY-like chemotaxis protein
MDCVPGVYVLMAVSDNGRGMSEEIQAHVFEPFFTTKTLGEGTGLGLATVYGIVGQNRGFINVYSEVGRGTTFRIYLPACSEEVLDATGEKQAEVSEGHETVLLVEDEPSILSLATQMLERLGYRTLAASTPGEALRLAREHAGEIHLLITDVVMPGMNGSELARQLLAFHPRLKSLFMSGYTANVIAHQGVIEKGVNFMQKPFSFRELSAKVRQALEG